MTVSDYVEISFLVLWLVCLVGVGVLSHMHFKNVKAERYRQDAVFAMKKWVGYYDKQDIDNPEKANRALDNAVKELQGKGYTISDQTVHDLEALREYVLTELRMKQAETGVNNTVKPAPDVAKDVPDADVVQPTNPLPAPVNKTAGGVNG